MAVQLMRTDRPAFASGDAFQSTPEEIKAGYEGYTTYFGSYIVDEVARTVTRHVQGHTCPNYSGSKVTLEFALVDQCLTLRASIRRDGRPLTALLIWTRAI